MSTISIPQAGKRVTRAPMLAAISGAHLISDLASSLLVASYPVLRGGFHLDYAQLGSLTLTYQLTSSLLQPAVGAAADRRPLPWSLAAGAAATACGLLALAFAETYAVLVAASLLLGIGSSIFHPEAARAARHAAAGRHGFAQSVFQLGGSLGSSFGPLLVALVVLPHGQASLAWLATLPIGALPVLLLVGRWSARQRVRPEAEERGTELPAAAWSACGLLFGLILAKFFYLASLSNYFVFFMEARFGTADGTAQMALMAVSLAGAAGGLIGGRLSDRLGTRTVIGLSFWGALPFSLALPHVGPVATVLAAAAASAVIASAFPAIVVHAQALMPHRIGLVSGLFFGAAFGMGGLAAAALGVLADYAGVVSVFDLCAFLPLAGLLVPLLPRTDSCQT